MQAKCRSEVLGESQQGGSAQVGSKPLFLCQIRFLVGGKLANAILHTSKYNVCSLSETRILPVQSESPFQYQAVEIRKISYFQLFLYISRSIAMPISGVASMVSPIFFTYHHFMYTVGFS